MLQRSCCQSAASSGTSHNVQQAQNEQVQDESAQGKDMSKDEPRAHVEESESIVLDLQEENVRQANAQVDSHVPSPQVQDVNEEEISRKAQVEQDAMLAKELHEKELERRKALKEQEDADIALS